MRTTDFLKLLQGHDLRTLGESGDLLDCIKTQTAFDALIKLLKHPDRVVVMRAADVIEKLSLTKPEYLKKHGKIILELAVVARDKELQWHLAQILPRLLLNKTEQKSALSLLEAWARDKKKSKIVRVNSLQSLFEMTRQNKLSSQTFGNILLDLEKEAVPSLAARIRMIKKDHQQNQS